MRSVLTRPAIPSRFPSRIWQSPYPFFLFCARIRCSRGAVAARKPCAIRPFLVSFVSIRHIHVMKPMKRGWDTVKGLPEERVITLALYIIENEATVRAAGKKFSISKSTVHKDITERLPKINANLYRQVKHVLDKNKAERHLRGGQATKRKYSLISVAENRASVR